MELSIIVAADENNGIGAEGNQPFFIRSDLKRFKSLTTGNTIVMGRKTFEALPNGALPNRKNIVLTHRAQYDAPNCRLINNPEELNQLCAAEEKVFVIGGGEIYRNFLPRVDRIYLTRVHSSFGGIDTWFPEISPDQWVVQDQEGPFTDEKSGLVYSYINFRRKPGQSIQS